MSGGRPIPHPVWDDGQGGCREPGCGRRLGFYDGRLMHRRGSGGRQAADRIPPERPGVLRARIRDLTEQVEQRDATIAALRARIADIEQTAHPFVGIHAKLDALLARPTVALVPTHRRKADGGIGGRRERRVA